MATPYAVVAYKENKPILRRVTIAPKLPPHQVALMEMERIKKEKGSQGDDVKQYYTELTDALRVYMEGRFGFNAMEMTSDEIIAHLNEQPDKEWIGELRTLFLAQRARSEPFFIFLAIIHTVSPIQKILKLLVITCSVVDLVSAVDLLKQHHAREMMREGHRRHREL